MDVKISKFPNGIRVATAQMPQVESATVGIWVGVGGRHEPESLSGVSHFIEHLLFKGTETRSAKEISEAVEGRGGYLNAFTQEESTCYYVRVSAEGLPKVLDVLADMYLHPRFDPSDIDKERGVIVEEIMMYRDEPEHLVEEMLGESLWTDHPLGRPLTGTPETLKFLTRARIRDFKRARYLPANTLLVFAGKVDHDECVRATARSVGALRPGKAPAAKPVTAAVGQLSVTVKCKEIEQTHLAMGVRLFGRSDERRHALRLLSVILGENMSSRLFQVVREKHGLAYSIHSEVHLFRETGVLAIAAGVEREGLHRTMTLIARELKRLRTQPVRAAELDRAKDYTVGQLRLGLESTVNQMMWTGESIMSYGRFISPEDVIREIRRVTAPDIQALAREVLQARRISTAVIAPRVSDRDSRRVAETIASAAG